MSACDMASGGRVPLAVPNIGTRESELVNDCLDRGWVSSAGEYVTEFERSVAEAVGGRHAVAVTSGTAALHLSLHLAGLERDQEVVVPSLTFIAPANGIRMRGAWPTLVDVSRRTWQIDTEHVRAFLASCVQSDAGLLNARTGRQVVGILPVHLLGHPAPMDELREIAEESELFIVEDAAESLGARYADGSAVGAGGRFVCFSFNGNKIVTTGGGGAIVTDDPAVAERGRFLSTQAKADPREYVHSEPGYNYRLTNLQAALGVGQMERLDDFTERKRQVSRRYQAELDGLGLEWLVPADGVLCTWWLSTPLLPVGVDRKGFIDELGRRGIDARSLWQPLHLSPALAGAWAADCPVAEELFARAVSLPSSTGLSDEDVSRTVQGVREALGVMDAAGGAGTAAVGGGG